MFILLKLDPNVIMQGDPVPVIAGATISEIKERALEDESFEYEEGQLDPDLEEFLDTNRKLRPGQSASAMTGQDEAYQLNKI